MRRMSRPGRRRRAAAAVEFALLLPLMVTLLLGLWELGRAIQVYQTVSNAAREGGRQASSAKYTKDQVRQAVFDYLKKSGVPLHDTLAASSVNLNNTNATIVVSNVTTGGEVFDADQLDKMKVQVSVPVKNFRWVLSSFFLPASTLVGSTSSFLCAKDVPIEVLETIPQRPLQ